MPLPPTPENILYRLLNDRIRVAKSSNERALLTLAIRAQDSLNEQRQELHFRIQEIKTDIQKTESQIRTLTKLMDRCLEGLAKYSVDDARMMELLGEKVARDEDRLRAVKGELMEIEDKLTSAVTVWATAKY
ncbi:hypothetical protein GQ54DRAFT_310091 [Martensiomyces pterosporus]|nr:hypothetical protein GQ54DRAFT_310091 [Martensiomyces pterosporus]